MFTFLKIATLLVCVAAALLLSRAGRASRTTCNLLSFFVAVGATAFFPEEEKIITLTVSVLLFFTLFFLTRYISGRSGKTREEKKKRTV